MKDNVVVLAVDDVEINLRLIHLMLSSFGDMEIIERETAGRAGHSSAET